MPGRIEDELVRRTGVHAAVEERADVVVLTGLIESEEERQAAYDIVKALAPEKRIIDNLDLEDVLPARLGDLELSEEDDGVGFPSATADTSDSEALEPGDFTDQRLLANADGAAGPGDDAGIQDEEISEGEEVYVPPTDPVRDGDNEVLGGFASTSMDSTAPLPSSDGTLGDEAIEDAVRRELREDAATTALELRVHVRNGVVRLRGRVTDILDSENAEEVASRVEGVVEVVDETDVMTDAF